MKMITLNEANVKSFTGIIPPTVVERFGRGKSIGIAAFAEDPKKEPEAKLIGTAVFSLDRGAQDDEKKSGTLQWIFVMESERGKGYGRKLLEEIKKRLTKAGIRRMYCDVPDTPESLQLSVFLSRNGFAFSRCERFEFSVTLGQCLKNERVRRLKISENVGRIMRYGSVGFRKEVAALEPVRSRREIILKSEYLLDQELSASYYSGELSEAMLLVEKNGYGELSPVAILNKKGSDTSKCAELIGFFIREAAIRYPVDTVIRVRCGAESTAELFRFFAPDLKPMMVLRGVFENN